MTSSAEPTAGVGPQAGDEVICADGERLGLFEKDEGTHLRVRRPEFPQLVWISKRLIAGQDAGVIRLAVPRDELHDGVIALPPHRQREYATLESLDASARRAPRR